MNLSKTITTCFLLLLTSIAFAQKKPAFVSGRILDDNEMPLSKVSVTILGKQSGITTNDSGFFRIEVPSDRAFALVFTYSGRRSEQKNFLLNENEEETITLRMEKGETV